MSDAQPMRLLKWLFTWSGTVTRGQYLEAGVILTGIKFLIDRAVAARFGVTWQLWNYFIPSHDTSLFHIRDPKMYAVLWAIALPFFWVGIGLTLRRLRATGAARGWFVLFFVPIVNLVFFLGLSLIPDAGGIQDEAQEPYASVLSAIGGLAASAAMSFLLVYFSVNGLGAYGGGLFLGIPFFMGFVSSALYNRQKPRSKSQSVAVGIAPLGLLGGFLLLGGYEGLICLLMAVPLAVPLAAAGALMARSIPWCRPPRPATPTMAAWLFVLPLAMVGEAALHLQPPVLHVTTSIDIDAPADVVWNNVISFPPLAPPKELIFRSGIAYPTSGEIYGTGVGAVRHCRFSTGEFIEPITVWDKGHLLAFDVSAQPMSMRELSPWNITPPHLERNYMLSRHGQFRFIALPGGRTRLEGTTWYQNYFWPQPYWRVWSDFIVHRIHRRVLEHVKAQAERKRE